MKVQAQVNVLSVNRLLLYMVVVVTSGDLVNDSFVLLNKEREYRYEYFRSQDFSAITIHELQRIYRNLQSVKAML